MTQNKDIKKLEDYKNLQLNKPLLIHFKWLPFIPQKNGKASHMPLYLISEILDIYKTFKTPHNQKIILSYKLLSEKFNTSHETLRRAFVTLEQLGFLKRNLRTIIHMGVKLTNILFIQINPKKIAELPPLE